MARAIGHAFAQPEVIRWTPPMRFASGRHLAPTAILLFAFGGAVGWGSVTAMRGCVAMAPAGPSAPGRGAAPTADAHGGDEGGGADGEVSGEAEGSPPAADGAAPALPTVPDDVPRGRAIAALSPEACFGVLEKVGVAHDRESVDASATDVAAPVRLEGPVAGVSYAHVGRSSTHEIMDCRLVLALLRWAPVLRAAGVARVEHMSAFRPAARVQGTAKPSAHATALAMDAARFHLDDGTELDVLPDWADKTRGAPPCDDREDEPEPQALLRQLVCDAVADDLFQVVITPHHNRAHHNHVHVELVPDVDWSFIR
jgi:hypothetical protein